MSIDAVGWAYKQTAPDAVAKAVLVRLADQCDADGLVATGTIAIERLAKDLQIAPTAAQAALRRLGAARLLLLTDSPAAVALPLPWPEALVR